MRPTGAPLLDDAGDFAALHHQGKRQALYAGVHMHEHGLVVASMRAMELIACSSAARVRGRDEVESRKILPERLQPGLKLRVRKQPVSRHVNTLALLGGLSEVLKEA